MARIVLIEDDGEFRVLLAEALRGQGYEVTERSDGLAGLAAVRTEFPDLVICDVELPKLHGHKVLEALRRDPEFESVPFVFLTGQDTPESVRLGMRSGADDYLTKPAQVRDVFDAVSARLARRDANMREGEKRLADLRRSVATLLPHEMRTPLTSLLGSLTLLEAWHRDLPQEEFTRLVGTALRAAHRLRRAAENYLLQSAFELQRLTKDSVAAPAFAGTSGRKEVEAAAREAASEAGRSQDLHLDLGEVAAPIGGPYLRKIVAELVDNALKFSDAGQPVVVRLSRLQGGAVLEVVDRGSGMSRAQVEKMGAFRQFERELLEQQGSGLGLALVKAMATATGGGLELVAAEGGGTCARVRWQDRPGISGPAPASR
jgi:signal transduction histidine kinase